MVEVGPLFQCGEPGVRMQPGAGEDLSVKANQNPPRSPSRRFCLVAKKRREASAIRGTAIPIGGGRVTALPGSCVVIPVARPMGEMRLRLDARRKRGEGA